MINTLTTKNLVDKLGLEVLAGEKGLDREITTSNISRPALELAGYFSYYTPTRIQVLGATELSFFNFLSKKEKESRMKMLCTRKNPCIIISRGMEAPKELLDAAKIYDTPILKSNSITTNLIAKITVTLQREFSPDTSVHGVFIEVYGIGMLITGDSGIGKSEIALELIKRGHRLIADDRVDIKEIEEGMLIGRCGSELIKNLLEIRGLGIINVMTLFGTGAVREEKIVNLNVHLESWNKNKDYERIGISNEYITIHNTKIEKKTIPVSPGRNMAIILESAAMNYRLNRMGINTAEEFQYKLLKKIQNSEESLE